MGLERLRVRGGEEGFGEDGLEKVKGGVASEIVERRELLMRGFEREPELGDEGLSRVWRWLGGFTA